MTPRCLRREKDEQLHKYPLDVTTVEIILPSFPFEAPSNCDFFAMAEDGKNVGLSFAFAKKKTKIQLVKSVIGEKQDTGSGDEADFIKVIEGKQVKRYFFRKNMSDITVSGHYLLGSPSVRSQGLPARAGVRRCRPR